MRKLIAYENFQDYSNLKQKNKGRGRHGAPQAFHSHTH